MSHADPVEPALWLEVAERDDWRCQAPLLDSSAGYCRGPFWSESRTPPLGSEQYRRILTVDHVPAPVHLAQRAKDDPARGQRRAPSRREHLVLLCHWHNTGGWASAHRDAERRYLAALYPEHWQQFQQQED